MLHMYVWGILVWFPAEAKDLCNLQSIQNCSGIDPAPYSMNTGCSFPGDKMEPGCEANHSPPSNAKVKNGYSDTSTPPTPLWGAQGQLYLLKLLELNLCIWAIQMIIQKLPNLSLGPRTTVIQLSAIRCGSIAIFWVGLVSFAAINLLVASQQVFLCCMC